MNKNVKFEIVKMDTTHIQSLMELETLSFSIPWTEKMFIEDLSNDKAFYFAALENKVDTSETKGARVIGYGGMWVVLDEGQITNIGVHPEFRRIGIARELIKKLIEASKELGVLSLTLEVRKSNVAAINLYKGEGFYEAGIRKGYYSDNSEDAIIMWNKL